MHIAYRQSLGLILLQDGGGIKSYSSLLIMKELMRLIQAEIIQQRPDTRK
jgi:hypothetical protein